MTQPVAAPGLQAGAGELPIRVMIVDDSAIARAMIARFLGEQPRIKVVASVPNGQAALDRLSREAVDIILLDIEMPVMNGLEALPRLIAAAPGAKVIMASSLTLRGAAISMEALQKGAADFVPKPSSTGELSSNHDFAREVTAKVLALGEQRERGLASRPSLNAPIAPRKTGSGHPGGPVALRPASRERPRVLAIGSSTGGPKALLTLFGGLGRPLRIPILLTQHMPPHFTAILAQHLARASGMACAEAVDGELLEPGRVFVAPGDHHLTVEEKNGQVIVRTSKAPPENYCRPAVDPMLRSVARCFGSRSLVLILTGMGHDGLNGAKEIAAAGGTVVAQDEASSVVWGMPGAVATNGLCSAVLPLDRIASHVRTLTGEQIQ